MVCTNEPVEYVPVTVIVYAPCGVPLLPVLIGLLLPHAIWKTKPANSIPISHTALSFLFPRLSAEPKPTRVATNPISDRQSAKNTPEPKEDIASGVGAIVLTVSVAGVPGITDPGLIEHVGASAGAGVTAQVSATELKNPFASAATLIVELAEPPALTAAGVSAEAETEKSESNVAPTVWAELTVTLHVPVPEHGGATQPTKLPFAGGVAVSVNIVPGLTHVAQLAEQLTPLPVTVPFPKNTTLRGKF